MPLWQAPVFQLTDRAAGGVDLQAQALEHLHHRLRQRLGGRVAAVLPEQLAAQICQVCLVGHFLVARQPVQLKVDNRMAPHARVSLLSAWRRTTGDAQARPQERIWKPIEGAGGARQGGPSMRHCRAPPRPGLRLVAPDRDWSAPEMEW